MNMTDNNDLLLAITARRSSNASAAARRTRRRELRRQLGRALMIAAREVYDTTAGYALFWLTILVWCIVIIQKELLL